MIRCFNLVRLVRTRADVTRLTLMDVVVIVANMHSGMSARTDTTVTVLIVPIVRLHRNDAVSCNAWYTLLQGVLLGRALSMVKRHFEGAKPEVSWTACGISCQMLHVHRPTPGHLSLLWICGTTVASICVRVELHPGTSGPAKVAPSMSRRPAIQFVPITLQVF